LPALDLNFAESSRGACGVSNSRRATAEVRAPRVP
jgi:hypothetical protein